MGILNLTQRSWIKPSYWLHQGCMHKYLSITYNIYTNEYIVFYFGDIKKCTQYYEDNYCYFLLWWKPACDVFRKIVWQKLIFWELYRTYIYIYFLFFLDPVTNICTSIRILFFINNYFLACNYFLVRMFKYQISSHKCYWYFSPILGHNFSGTFYFHKIIRCSSNSSQTENNRNIISKGQMRSIPNCVL